MPEITVELSEDAYNRLAETADLHEIDIDQAAQRAIETWNDRPHSGEELDETINEGKSFDSSLGDDEDLS